MGSIYQYFQSKEKILETLLELELRASIKKFDDEIRGLLNSSIEEKVNGVINNISNLFIENAYLLQAQKLFSQCDSFNMDHFFDNEILTRAKDILTLDSEGQLSNEVEKFLSYRNNYLLHSL